MINQILSFGEILIRQQPTGAHFFGAQNNTIKLYPGGSEANVAVSLALMGESVSYVSAFPENALSTEIITLLKEYKVNTDKVIYGGDRLGQYILLGANGLSKGEVIYDRKYSSFSMLKASDLVIEDLLAGVSWFHWSALTPALNEDMAQLMEEILKVAQAKGITISVDLNYRNKLWQYGKEPIAIMPRLAAYCDVIMGNIWAAEKMLGTSVDQSLDRNTTKEHYLEAANQSAKEVFARYPRCQHLAYTFRFMDHAQHNLFYGSYHSPSINTHSETLETNKVTDRIGSGDAFMAGFIHALRQAMEPQEIINSATNAGFAKLFVAGDFGNGKIN